MTRVQVLFAFMLTLLTSSVMAQSWARQSVARRSGIRHWARAMAFSDDGTMGLLVGYRAYAVWRESEDAAGQWTVHRSPFRVPMLTLTYVADVGFVATGRSLQVARFDGENWTLLFSDYTRGGQSGRLQDVRRLDSRNFCARMYGTLICGDPSGGESSWTLHAFPELSAAEIFARLGGSEPTTPTPSCDAMDTNGQEYGESCEEGLHHWRNDHWHLFPPAPSDAPSEWIHASALVLLRQSGHLYQLSAGAWQRVRLPRGQNRGVMAVRDHRLFISIGDAVWSRELDVSGQDERVDPVESPAHI